MTQDLPSNSFHVTRWWSSQPDITGYWGPSTSSIDWCESNYAVTRFIAEFSNTLTNLIFVALALYGLKKCREARLSIPLALCQVGIALVGVGSFLFHATLKYEWQLGDELPMIYCSCLIAYVAFDIDPNQRSPSPSPPSSPSASSSQPQSKPIKIGQSIPTKNWFRKSSAYLFSLYAIMVTLIYLNYPNPVFHQVAYGFIQMIATFQVGSVLYHAPRVTIQQQRNRKDIGRCEILGTGLFLLGFSIWNIDNLFCDQISSLKQKIGSPWSFLIEGHAWWHLLTGTGVYFLVVGIQLLSVSLNEGADGYEMRYNRIGLPFVARIPIHHPSTIHKRVA